MIPASNTMLELLASLTRNVVVEVIVQYPNPLNSLQQGGQLILDGVLDITINRNQEPSSDTFDMTVANTDGRYSPFS
jgi:hypothetical protein